MRDYGIDRGLVEFRDDEARSQRGWSKGFWSFRKMFRDYLGKLNVPFYDACCPALSQNAYPVRFLDQGEDGGIMQRFDPETNEWITIDAAAFIPDPLEVDNLTVNSNLNGNTIDGALIRSEAVQTNIFQAFGQRIIRVENNIFQTGLQLTAGDVPFTLSAQALLDGFIISNNTGNVTYTLPLATDLATELGVTSASRGGYFDVSVINAGSGILTIAVNTGITAVSALTGGTTLTIPAGANAGFRLVQSNNSGSAWTISRLY